MHLRYSLDQYRAVLTHDIRAIVPFVVLPLVSKWLGDNAGEGCTSDCHPSNVIHPATSKWYMDVEVDSPVDGRIPHYCIHVFFHDANIALLFKLTWGGHGY